MLYPINSQDKKNNVVFRSQIKKNAQPNLEAIATLNYRLYQKINTIKSIYLEAINQAKSNSVFASKMASGINNIRIEDSIITVLGDNNTSIKLSMLEVGVSKLFRIKFLENKELKNMITVDNYKLVERVNKKEILYLKKNDIKEEELDSRIENLYKVLDEPFLNLRRHMHSKEVKIGETPNEKSVKFKPVLEKIEVAPGVTPDMLPTSTLPYKEDKPLFSYAALITKNEPQKSQAKKEITEVLDEQPIQTKRRGRPPKTSIVSLEQKENTVSTPKRRGRPPKANRLVPLKPDQNKSLKKIDNSVAGQLPASLTEKIRQIEGLYLEINNLWKDFSHTKFVRLKKLFNVSTRRKQGLYFDLPNEGKLSVIKLERKDFKDSNLLKIKFDGNDTSQNIFAVIDNAKNLVCNISGKNNQAFYSKLRYQTQNEVNNTIYQANFQAVIDKVINNLAELKKSLVNQEWQANNYKKTDMIFSKKKIAEKPIKNEPIPNYVLPEHLTKQIQNLWQELKSIEELGKANRFHKRDSKLLVTERGSTAFQFVDKDKSILIDKNVNKQGTQFRFVIKKDKDVEKTIIITEDGLIVKNTQNGHIPISSKLKFVVEGDETNELLADVVKSYNKIKKYSKKYRKEVEDKIKKQAFEKNSKSEFVADIPKDSMAVEEVKGVMDNIVEELDNPIVEIKKDFDVVQKFNRFIEKVMQCFKEFLEKFNTK